MTKYRLKSKLYGEFDGEEKKKSGILGTGISAGQALMIGGTVLAGRKMYNNHLVKTGQAGANLMARYKSGSQKQQAMFKTGQGVQNTARQLTSQQQIANAQSQAQTTTAIDNLKHSVGMNRVAQANQAAAATGATNKDRRAMASAAYNSSNEVVY